MSRYRFSRSAQSDVDAIWRYVAQEASLETADRLLDSLEEKFALLANSPEAGSAREEIAPGTRMFPSGDYLIYYRKDPRGGIRVSRIIIHGKRDQKRAWRDKKP